MKERIQSKSSNNTYGASELAALWEDLWPDPELIKFQDGGVAYRLDRPGDTLDIASALHRYADTGMTGSAGTVREALMVTEDQEAYFVFDGIMIDLRNKECIDQGRACDVLAQHYGIKALADVGQVTIGERLNMGSCTTEGPVSRVYFTYETMAPDYSVTTEIPSRNPFPHCWELLQEARRQLRGR